MYLDDNGDFFYERGSFLIFLIVVRFIIAFYCGKRAKKLNRNEFGWFIFGFVLPIVALIIIHFMKPRFIWDSISGIDVSRKIIKKPEYKITVTASREIIFWMGLILILFGAFKIIQYFFPAFENIYLVPTILVGVGLVLLFKNPREPN